MAYMCTFLIFPWLASVIWYDLTASLVPVCKTETSWLWRSDWHVIHVYIIFPFHKFAHLLCCKRPCFRSKVIVLTGPWHSNERSLRQNWRRCNGSRSLGWLFKYHLRDCWCWTVLPKDSRSRWHLAWGSFTRQIWWEGWSLCSLTCIGFGHLCWPQGFKVAWLRPLSGPFWWQQVDATTKTENGANVSPIRTTICGLSRLSISHAHMGARARCEGRCPQDAGCCSGLQDYGGYGERCAQSHLCRSFTAALSSPWLHVWRLDAVENIVLPCFTMIYHQGGEGSEIVPSCRCNLCI